MSAFTLISNDAGSKKCFLPGAVRSQMLRRFRTAGEKRLRACPGAAAILKTARIKPREFMVITGALFSDFIAVGLKRHGSAKEYPATISPENAAFIDQNFEKLQAMMAPLSCRAK